MFWPVADIEGTAVVMNAGIAVTVPLMTVVKLLIVTVPDATTLRLVPVTLTTLLIEIVPLTWVEIKTVCDAPSHTSTPDIPLEPVVEPGSIAVTVPLTKAEPVKLTTVVPAPAVTVPVIQAGVAEVAEMFTGPLMDTVPDTTVVKLETLTVPLITVVPAPAVTVPVTTTGNAVVD